MKKYLSIWPAIVVLALALGIALFASVSIQSAGYTILSHVLVPDWRFFLGWAQVWASNIRPEAARLQVNVDPHPLARFRVDGPLSNMSVFTQAFDCNKGDPMVRNERCIIW